MVSIKKIKIIYNNEEKLGICSTFYSKMYLHRLSTATHLRPVKNIQPQKKTNIMVYQSATKTIRYSKLVLSTRLISQLVLLVLLGLLPQPSSQWSSNYRSLQKKIPYEGVWQHEIMLEPDGGFLVQWTPLEDEIMFRITVQTRGYVSFGLNDKSTMDGADIVVGWVHSGRAYLQDRHAVGNSEPKVDQQQDWSLKSGYENDTHTILVMSRPYDTCDKYDYQISSDTVNLLWAYHPDDPVNPEHAWPRLHYHGWRRGAVTTLMLDQSSDKLPKNVLAAYRHGGKTFEYTARLRAPMTQDWYLTNQFVEVSKDVSNNNLWCNVFKRPHINVKHHVVKYEPVIRAGHEDMISHMLVYECRSVSPEVDIALEELVAQGVHECKHQSLASYTCNHVMVVWTRGSKGFTFPVEVGYPLNPDGAKFFLLEVQYNTEVLSQHGPAMAHSGNVWDAAGMRIMYTSEIRMHDAGVLSLGISPNWKQIIPPQQRTIVSEGHCVADCTREALPQSGIHVFGSLHSTHDLGRNVRVRHIRNGHELRSITQDNNHNPNNTQYRVFHKTRKVLPGDHLITECKYNSDSRRGITLGGIKPKDETCLSYLFYWPRTELSVCHSKPSLNTVLQSLGIEKLTPESEPIKILRPLNLYGKTLEWRLLHYDWKQQFQYFQHSTSTGTFNPMCRARGHSVLPGLENIEYKYPNISKPWTSDRKCKHKSKLNHHTINKNKHSHKRHKHHQDIMNDQHYEKKPIEVIDVELHYIDPYAMALNPKENINDIEPPKSLQSLQKDRLFEIEKGKEYLPRFREALVDDILIHSGANHIVFYTKELSLMIFLLLFLN